MNNSNHIDGVSGMEPLEGAALPDDFPQRLKRLKEASGLSWRGMARAIGIDHNMLLRWRRGTVPSGGGYHVLLCFAATVHGGVQILVGEGLQMTFFED